MKREEIDLMGLRSVLKKRGVEADVMVDSLAQNYEALRARIRGLMEDLYILEEQNDQLMRCLRDEARKNDELRAFIEALEN